MRPRLTLLQKQSIKTLSLVGFIMLTLFSFNPLHAQTTSTTSAELTVKGLVSDEEGALEGVNVFQKGTKIGTVTNEKGEFTFPSKLKIGAILIFSYLGFENQEFVIKDNSTFIKLVLTEDLVEMIGALDTATPYKSRRKH